MGYRYRVGVDENGLGPRLGPLVVTAVMARVDATGPGVVGRKARGALASRLGDSKGLVAHGSVGLGQAWARALGGPALDTPDELVRALALEPPEELRAPCPAHVLPQCWGTGGEAFLDDEPSRELEREVARDVGKLAHRGVELVAVRSSVVCVRRINDAQAEGRSRSALDLHAMERLVLALRAEAGEELGAVCGKVGGFKSYGPAFGPLAGRLHAVVEETPARSAYRFPGLGELAFEQDCDAHDLLVGMASLVGKWLRELLMARIVRHYRARDAGLPDASGYHDPVTGRFVVATERLRRAARVPDACFERARAGRPKEP